MAKSDSPAARTPRGTKPVAQAFFNALEQTPEVTRAAIGKAALSLVRDELKSRRDKLKLAAAKEREKARKPAPTPKLATKATPQKVAPKSTPAAKPAAHKAQTPAKAVHTQANGAAQPAPAPKRRPRKPADDDATSV